jgi:hypothetical protein
MPNPKCLKVGDFVRFVSLPDEWSQKGFSVPHDDIAFMKKMVKRSWPSRVFMIDEYGDPWISARIRERGKYYYHTWKIAESTGWRQVKMRKGKLEGVMKMSGKGRQTPRKPATKFAHLRKKMEKAKIGAKIRKK